MHLDAFKQLKIGDKLTTLGVISSRNGKFGEIFIVPTGTIAIVKTGEIIYAKEVDDFYCECDVEYESRIVSTNHAMWSWKNQVRIGQIAVNPADVILSES